jgi:catechol 2,3-dioxygenase-like lactoylglutathione lyase family enzyme
MDIHSVNHVGMAVRDMARTAARYEAMGFLLTPYSVHSGAWKRGEAVARQGYGNRCVMFRNNYLEILASENDAAPSERITNFLARHQGAHIICFGTQDPGAVGARLQAAGIVTSEVLPLQRDVDTPEGMRTAKFQRVIFSPGASPEGFIQAALHLTPQYIHQPRYMTHPNGAVALSKVFVVTEDPEGFEARYARYCGCRAERGALERIFRFPLVGAVSIVAARDVSQVLSGSLHPPLPCIAAVGVQTADLAALRARLEKSAVAHLERDHRVIVAAEEAMGLAIVFEETK